MLLVKPYILWSEAKDKKKQREQRGGDVELVQQENPYQVFKVITSYTLIILVLIGLFVGRGRNRTKSAQLVAQLK